MLCLAQAAWVQTCCRVHKISVDSYLRRIPISPDLAPGFFDPVPLRPKMHTPAVQRISIKENSK
jgi:hypothetical protein